MSRRTRRIALPILLLVGVGVSASFWAGRETRTSPTARVALEDFRVVVEATGKLEAAVNFEIGPPSVRDFWQYNLSWMIPEGSDVSEGDVLARFDATDLDDRLREHRATLETTLQEREKEERNLEISLRQLRLDLVKAEGELKKVELDLSVPENLVASIEVQQNRLKQTLARRRVEFLTEKIEFSQELVESKLEILDVKRQFSESKIDYNEESKEKFNVRAPVSGLVIYVPKRNGDRWEVGEAVWMLAKILNVADVSTLRVEAAVLEVDAAKISPGQIAEISVDAIPGLTIQSQIDDIGRIVHERSLQDQSKVFDAFLPIGDIDTELLRPGMGVKVKIETAHLKDRLTVPLDAVRASEQGTYVEVLLDGAVERREVTLGPRNKDRVVVETGLERDEVVMLTTGGRA